MVDLATTFGMAMSFPFVVWWLVFVVNVVVGVVVIVRCFATGGAVIVAVVDDAAFGVGCLCRGSAIVFSVISTATIAITVAIVETVGRKVLFGGCCW